MPESVKIFSGTSHTSLAQEIAAHYGSGLGEIEIKRFSDGEIHVRFEENIRGAEVYLVQSTPPPAENLMELLLMIDAARRASARYVTVVIPYFGYARQDRKDQPRVAIAAKLVANMLAAAGASRVIALDLHAGQIQGFFDFPVDHLDSNAVFIPYLKNLNIENLILASPDVGGVKRVRSFAGHLGTEIVICDKIRVRANEVAGIQVIGNVEGKNAVLVDDMVDTAGTLCKAAEALIEAGAVSVRAVCTHPILSGNAYEKIQNSRIDELAVADTLPLKQNIEKIKVLSVSKLLSEAIYRVHTNESISSLFI